MSDADSRTWDRTMTARLRAGDDVALASIHDRYGAMVNGIAVRLVGADQARDVTQDVLLQLWRHPERYDADRGGLASYLAVAARRRSIDLLRSRARRESRERRARDAEPAAVAPSVEATALAAISAAGVRAAMGRLPSDQRQAIELAYFKGLTYRQVAQATATAEGTAKSRMRLGLARLARELGSEGPPDQEQAWN